LGDTPDETAWRLCALAPLSAFDRQRLLEAPDPEKRLTLLIDLLRAIGEDLSHILAGG
jgi:Lon protease-like protein